MNNINGNISFPAMEVIMPSKSPLSTCTVAGCDGKFYARGFCYKHYCRWQRHGDPSIVKPAGKQPTKFGCSVEGCDRPHRSSGMCMLHYNQWRTTQRTGNPCSVDGCDKPAIGRGLCNAHYQRLQAHGDTATALPKGRFGARAVYDLSPIKDLTTAGAYVLGLAASDGCVERSRFPVVSWKMKDREPLEIIRRELHVGSPIRMVHQREGSYFRIRLAGEAAVSAFMDRGILPRKSLSFRLPAIDDRVLPHFLRGVLDGDGCIMIRRQGAYKRLVVTIASGSDGFLTDLHDVIGYGAVRPVSGKPGKRVGSITFDCSKAVDFLTMIYRDSDGLRLTRKWQKWQDFLASGQSYRPKG